jgi:PAS domain S-box-containing protein
LGADQGLLAAIVGATDAGIFVNDAMLVIRAFNPAAERLFERPAVDVVGASASTLFATGESADSHAWIATPGAHRAVPRLGDRVLAAVDVSVSAITIADEQWFVARLHAVPAGAARGPGTAQTSEGEMFRAAVEAMEDAVVVVWDGARVYVNRAYVTLFGYATRDEALSEPRHGRWHPEDAAARDAQEATAGPLALHRVLLPDGNVKLVEGTRSDLTFEGEPATLPVMRDVTHREQTLRGFSEGESGLWPMFERLPVGVAIIDRDRCVIAANQVLARMLDATPDELKGTEFSRAFPSTTRSGQRPGPGSWERIVSGEIDFATSERDVVDPSLESTRVRVTSFGVRGDAGESLYSVQTVEDISDRSAVEQALRASDALFWQTFEQAPIGMAIVGVDRNIVHANPALATMVGTESAALTGTWFGRLFPSRTTGRAGGTWEQLARGDITYFEDEREVVAPGATASWVSVATSSVTDENGEMRYAVRIVQDITQRKRAEQELRDSEANYRQLFEAAPFAVAVMDLDRRLISVNGAMVRLFDRPEAELLEWRLRDLGPPDIERELPGHMREVLAGEREAHEFERPYQRRDGATVWARGRVSALRDATGSVKAAMVILEDVTLRNQALQELQDSEAGYRQLFETAPFAVAVLGLDARMTSVNESLERLLGRDAAELEGIVLRTLHPADYEREAPGSLGRVFRGEMGTFESERPYRRNDGEIVWAIGRTSALRDGDPPGRHRAAPR